MTDREAQAARELLTREPEQDQQDATADRELRKNQAIAARQAAQERRKGKQKSFRPAVGARLLG